MGYQSLDVEPLAGAMGAVIHGVDLTAELSNQAFDEIHQAFLEYKAVFFHSQDLDPHQQIAFARRFGPMTIYPFMEGLPEAPEAFEILKTETDVRNFGGGWHSDMSFTTKPPLGTMLYALEMPDAGGDTMFANTALAYDALSGGMKDMLDGLVGIYSAALKRGGGRAKSFKNATAMSPKNMDQVEMEAEHPIVRTHPETGRRALFVNIGHTVRFAGMTEEESVPILDFLYRHQIKPEFVCRFIWRPGSLAFWDNRCSQHYPVNDYHGHTRLLHRITLKGDRPF